jgi:hypothetical protein
VVIVRIKLVPDGIPVTTPEPNVPALACTVVPVATIKCTRYVPAPLVSHTGPLILIGEFAHGMPQLVGAVILIELTQLPLVAVTVMLVPNGIFIILFPLILPPVVVTTPKSLLNEMLHEEVPHSG